MLKIISKTKCVLGEGLYLNKDKAYWVDIQNKRIFSTEKKFNFKVKFTPSVILCKKKTGLIIGTNKGIYNFKNKKKVSLIASFEKIFNSKTHRSNDGCYIEKNTFLIGIMPIKNSGTYGKLLLVDHDQVYDLKFKIKIPNTFINLGKNNFLISDSYSRITYRIKICLKKKIIKSKKIFLRFKKYIPDGGCLFPGKKIAIAIWNGGKILILNKDGRINYNINLPIKRPTNCKFDFKKKKLFFTSAMQGLKNKERLKKTLSGHTFCINKADAIFNNY